jgi:carbamoyl-phosphate synthase large subunit
VDLIVNTPFGSPGQSGPRLDGYEIRTAAVRRGIPCVTTAAGLAAAVHGIEAIIRGEVGVRSLQEHAALLAGAGGSPAARHYGEEPRVNAGGFPGGSPGGWNPPGSASRAAPPGED